MTSPRVTNTVPLARGGSHDIAAFLVLDPRELHYNPVRKRAPPPKQIAPPGW